MDESTQKSIDKALHHFEWELSKIQMGRANPALVEDILVEQYGSMSPIKNCASVSVLDTQTISIAPWDKTLLHPIAKAISDAGVGLNPQTMTESVMIKIPDMTEDRRKDTVKVLKKFAEDAKVSIRNIRAEAQKTIKKKETDKEISEDQARDMMEDVQKLVDEANKKIDEATKVKETDIMHV